MPDRIKVGLCFLLGFGAMAGVCSIIKTAYLPALAASSDVTYSMTRLAITTVTEQWIILIVGCIPSLRPLFRVMTGKSLSSSGGRSGPYAGPYGGPGSAYGKGQTIITTHNLSENQRNTKLGRTYGVSGGASGTTTTRDGLGDEIFEMKDTNTSEESIIKNMTKGGIMLTTDVRVDYHDMVERGNNSDDGNPIPGDEAIALNRV